MADREKVIYDIERCICHVPDACRDCSHYQDDPELDCMEKLLADALPLLKEQDAVEPFSDDDGAYWCGSCHEDMVWHQKFCSNCGRPVLWKDR